jgi:predicted PurR-regulated permease PerM
MIPSNWIVNILAVVGFVAFLYWGGLKGLLGVIIGTVLTTIVLTKYQWIVDAVQNLDYLIK